MIYTLPYDHQQDLDRMPHYYWWHRSRIGYVADLAKRYLPPGSSLSYVDLGGGSGATTIEIAQELANLRLLNVGSGNVLCVDGDTGLEALQKSKPIDFCHMDLNGAWVLRGGPYQFFTLLDVLEHLDDPVQFLATLRAQLPSGTAGVITVPAYTFLLSEWDTRLGHRRRYTKSLLQKHVESAGFTVIWSSYCFSFLLLPVLFLRKIVKAKPASSEFPPCSLWLNSLLQALGRLEIQCSRFFSIPFGTSVIMYVAATGRGGRR